MLTRNILIVLILKDVCFVYSVLLDVISKAVKRAQADADRQTYRKDHGDRNQPIFVLFEEY